MPITVAIEDESGCRIADLWTHPHIDAALLGAGEDTTCLRYVDPYGDTVFNQLQLPVLLVELMKRSLALDAEGPRAAIAELVARLKRVQGEAHTYVRFIGD